MIVRSCHCYVFLRMRIHFYCFYFAYFIGATSGSYGQTISKYDSLYTLIKQSETNKKLQEKHLHTFLTEAKKDKNDEEIVQGYKNFMQYSDNNNALNYADSMIYAAQQSNQNAILGSAFLSKGIFFYGQKNYIQALNDYLQAQNYLSKTEDYYLQHKVNYNIANIKYYLGSYEEAIDLFKECIAYFKTENPRAYLNSLHSLALCYTRMGNIGLSQEIVELGLKEGERLAIDKMQPYFYHVEGINHYFKDNYGLAIEKLTSVAFLLEANNDFANSAVGNFYIGKSYWALKNKTKAIEQFKKVDQTFREKNYIRDDLREAYELLIQQAKAEHNLEEQLYYFQQLTKADSVLGIQFKQVSQKIHREYDHQKIHAEKENIQKQLNDKSKKETRLIYAIGFFAILSLSIIFIHFHNRRLYKKRYNQWQNKEIDQQSNLPKSSLENEMQTISERPLMAILAQLEKFEKNHKFRDKELTLSKLASACNTNPKYLSLAIRQSRDQSFTEYVNSLKVKYFIELLKTNRRLKNYTHHAMADEAGFSSTPRFTSAFKKHTGISLSFYIQQIKEEGKQV